MATQEYIVAPPSAGVTKAVLTIPVTVDKNSPVTRINETGQLELVALNTPRFNFDPVTLEPQGLSVEPAVTNLVYGDIATDLAKDKESQEQIDHQSIGVGFPVYTKQEEGVSGTRVIL